MNDMNVAPAAQTFHYHWWRFWKALAVACALAIAAFAGMLIWPPMGFMLLALAVTAAVGVCLFRAWNSFRFIDGNRLVRRHGTLGCEEDVYTLFGVISPRQTPILGRWFDVGSVQLRVLGQDVHINHIANFAEFHQLLVYGAEQQQQVEHQAGQQFFQVNILMPHPPDNGSDHGWEFPAEQAQQAHFYVHEIRE